MDLKSLIEKMDEIEASVVEQTDTPTQFTPTHFHKNNLGGKIPLMKTPDGKWWWISQTKDASGMPGPQGIVPWYGNTENRSAWNPASVDGEIQNGKYVDYPEGVTWKTASSSTTAPTPNALGVQPQTNIPGSPTDTAKPGQSGMPDNSAEMEKIKELEKLVDRYISLKRLSNESKYSISKQLIESFGYHSNDGYLSEADAAAISKYGNISFDDFLQGAKNLGKGIIKKAATPVAAAMDAMDAWKEIKELPPDMPENEWRQEVTRIVSQLIASIGLFWAGAILGALAGSAVVPGLGTIGGLIAGGAGGMAADYVLGDDLETIVDALVDKLYQGLDTDKNSGTTPVAVNQQSSTSSNEKSSQQSGTNSDEKPVVGDEDIIALQRMLKKDGYDLGTYGPNGDGIDGKIGPKTIAALQQDLVKLGAKNPDGSPLAVTGVADEATGKAIQQFYLS